MPTPRALAHEINDEDRLKWLTDDGLQRLPRCRREMSSSSTDDDLDNCKLLEMGARWANKCIRYNELHKVQMRMQGVNVLGVQTLQFLDSMPLTATSVDSLSLQLVDATTRRLCNSSTTVTADGSSKYPVTHNAV